MRHSCTAESALPCSPPPWFAESTTGPAADAGALQGCRRSAQASRQVRCVWSTGHANRNPAKEVWSWIERAAAWWKDGQVCPFTECTQPAPLLIPATIPPSCVSCGVNTSELASCHQPPATRIFCGWLGPGAAIGWWVPGVMEAPSLFGMNRRSTPDARALRWKRCACNFPHLCNGDRHV